MKTLKSLDIAYLKALYQEQKLGPEDLVRKILKEAQKWESHNIWITLLSEEQIGAYIRNLPPQPTADTPLWGIPFAIKDNIDLAGVPTTAACPDYAYTPEEDASCVSLLIEAGAIPIGKTNLDQFATGLVGTRSPYGIYKNAIQEEYISGGSSSGSAVAVAAGLVSFALGTDTAGSGRVPAALNGLIGLKPSRGLISNHGVVPACKSLDCVAAFTLNSADASTVFSVMNQADPKDPYSSKDREQKPVRMKMRLGIPREDQLEFFGNQESKMNFERSKESLKRLGHELVEIDFQPFIDTAQLLYQGPWVAERYAAIETFIREKPESLHPVTFKIIKGAEKYSATDTFKAQYELKRLQNIAGHVWDSIDALVTPTIGTLYTIEEVEKDPVQRNTDLGYYTNFMNLLDLCAIALPSGSYANGMPFGITITAPKYSENQLLAFSESIEKKAEYFKIAVCGAHMEGLALNHQLTELGAQFVREARTSPCYRLYNLKTLDPIRPGMIRQDPEGQPL